MEYNIRTYVDELFQNAPRTQKAYELKVELTQNLLDKYNALVEEGKSPQDAYSLTVLSIGDVRELFEGLDEEPVPASAEYMGPEPSTKSHGAITALAVMLYILSVVPIIILSVFNSELLNIVGVVLMFVMIAAATGLLVYNNSTKPKATKAAPGTVVGDFKQWQNQGVQKKQLLKLVESIFWPLVLAAYFLLSFGTGKWGITWIIFLIAPAIDGIIRAVFALSDPNSK